ncbi:MAG: oligosaccharide flippase family protein, partial [Candidatus Cloacimonetes bacterium]|nr:oligosaccharide flippase family protein [Candidatus Cloacimonadota bacterium]
MNHSLSMQTLFVVIGKSSEKIILLLIAIILARYLTMQEFGNYRQVMLVFSTLVVIFTLGIPNSINYFVPLFTHNRQKTMIIQTFIVLSALGIVMSTIMFIFSRQFAILFRNEQLELYLKIFSIASLFYLPSQSYANVFISIKKVNIVGILGFGLGLIKLIFILISIYLKLNLDNILKVLILFSIVQFLVYFIIILKLFKDVRFKIDLAMLKEQILFTLPLGLAAMIGILIRKMDQIMISTFFTPKEYAIYSNGAFEIPFLMILSTSAMAVLMPLLVNLYKENKVNEFVDKWNKSIIKVSLIIFPITIFFIFYAKEAMIIIFSLKYSESSQVFSIYLISQLIKITVFGNVLLILGKSKLIIRYSVITLFLNFILNYLFINIFGFIGPAIATVVSIGVIALLQLIKIGDILKIKIKYLWQWKKLSSIL